MRIDKDPLRIITRLDITQNTAIHFHVQLLVFRINILDPSANRPPLNTKHQYSVQCEIEDTHRNPSCRRNTARFVPLLQNLMAYDRVVIVAACPLTQAHQSGHHILPLALVPRIKHPPKYILSRLYFSAFIYLQGQVRTYFNIPHDITYAIWPMLLDTA